MIRECWDDESKSVHATACTHDQANRRGDSSHTVMLSALAFAHEIGLTGNKEHLRIFREAFKAALESGRDLLQAGNVQAQAGYFSRWFHFTPYGLQALEDVNRHPGPASGETQ